MFTVMNMSRYGKFGSVLWMALFFLPLLYVKYAYQFYNIKTKIVLLLVTILVTILFTVSIVEQQRPTISVSRILFQAIKSG